MESFVGLSAHELMSRKDAIESEIKLQLQILDGQKSVGMEGSLLDSEGFPRSDIDLYVVRMARNRVICLRNDHKAVMDAIEKKLHDIHAEVRESAKATSKEAGHHGGGATLPKGFAKVNTVTENSPAAAAGLKIDDVIVEFGTLNAANFTGLSDLAIVAQHSTERPVRVVVIRQGSVTILSITPRPWGGKGVLGCNVTSL